jgi:EXLDI family protein
MMTMPNKTIYVADADLALFQRAQDLTGDSLSATITQALRRLVDVEESKARGFEEVMVKVGSGKARRAQRFQGLLLAKEGRTTKEGRVETYRVYQGRTGRFVVHLDRTAGYRHTAGPDGKATGWRKHLAAEQQWGELPATSTLEVVDELDALREKVPDTLYDIVAEAVSLPQVEDLDV